MWFKDNESLEKRALDKKMGRVKYELIETKGFKPSDVKMWWKRNTKDIEVKGAKVAWASNDGASVEKNRCCD